MADSIIFFELRVVWFKIVQNISEIDCQVESFSLFERNIILVVQQSILVDDRSVTLIEDERGEIINIGVFKTASQTWDYDYQDFLFGLVMRRQIIFLGSEARPNQFYARKVIVLRTAFQGFNNKFDVSFLRQYRANKRVQ